MSTNHCSVQQNTTSSSTIFVHFARILDLIACYQHCSGTFIHQHIPHSCHVVIKSINHNQTHLQCTAVQCFIVRCYYFSVTYCKFAPNVLATFSHPDENFLGTRLISNLWPSWQALFIKYLKMSHQKAASAPSCLFVFIVFNFFVSTKTFRNWDCEATV